MTYTVERIAVEARTPAWFTLRRKFLTASDVAAVAGVDPNRGTLRVWNEKLGLVPDLVENGAMRRGRLSEGTALEYLAEDRPGWTITRPNAFYADHLNRLGCTPDAFVTDEDGKLVNCQIKTVNRPAFERWPLDAQGKVVPPLGYRLQVVTENMLVGATRGVLAVLVMSAYDAFLEIIDVPRHEKAEARIGQLSLDFWDTVESGRRPVADYAKDADVIERMFPRHEPGKVIDLSGDNRLAALLPEREQIKGRMDLDKKALEAIDAEIKDKLGDAEIAELPGWRLTWKAQERKGYTVAPSTMRPLHVKQIEEKEQAA